MGDYLCNSKDQLGLVDRSGVYRLECGVCSASYVGKTLRKLKTRCKEHTQRKDSKFYEHLLKEGHKDGSHTVALLHTERNSYKLGKLEEIEIKINLINPKCLNLVGEGINVRMVGESFPPRLAVSRALPSVQVASLLTRR